MPPPSKIYNTMMRMHASHASRYNYVMSLTTLLLSSKFGGALFLYSWPIFNTNSTHLSDTPFTLTNMTNNRTKF